MRLRSIAREAWRNVISGTTHAVALAVTLAVASLTLVGVDIAAVQRLESDARAFQAAGASTMTISSPGNIDGRRCEDLGHLPGVTAAGAVATAPGAALSVAALPDAPIPTGRVTPGFPLFQGSRSDVPGGVVLSREAADMLGLQTGDPLSTATDGKTTVAGIYDYPRDGRRSGFGYMVLVPEGMDHTFDECWVEVWPANEQITSLLLTALVPGTAAENELPTVGQLNASLGQQFDGYADYTHRLTRFGGIVAGLIATVLGFLALRTRRVQLASALHVGVRREDLTAICALEAAAWVLPAPIMCMATSISMLGIAPDGMAAAVIGARVALPLVIGAACGQALALATTRERHLFMYARDR